MTLGKLELDKLKVELRKIDNKLRESSFRVDVLSRESIQEAFQEHKDAKGLYTWYATCNPYNVKALWIKRKALYQKYMQLNSESNNSIKTFKGDSIKFLLPEINPKWNQDSEYNSQEYSDVCLYVGAAKGNKETLRERILCHYNGSIQTSALKLIGSTLEKQRKANSLIKEFLEIESELIDDFKLHSIYCEVILIDQSESDRLYTYERILRECRMPLIGRQ
ncbi:hypothetical protein J7E78_01290 [Paenibacillus polymyxa]|uniref:hypothetical protein n=1 Tax=Paenibacillus polymyxa TaxID=1406 RepID=UPI001BE5D44B|nr:hypothetical protein [Paenibacillus polymyxa]MBT2282186.1 hypothetical protein [Paenibacillus polymyxa]